MKSGSRYARQEKLWQSKQRVSLSQCFLPRHHVCTGANGHCHNNYLDSFFSQVTKEKQARMQIDGHISDEVYLREMMLLSVGAAAVEAIFKVIVALPS